MKDNESPVLGVSATFNPLEYYSEVTCISKTGHGRKGSKYTETNPFAVGFLRPSVQELDDTEPSDVPTATKARIGRMLGNAVSVQVDLATILTPSGALFMPDQRIRLLAPGSMIYSETEFAIRIVRMKLNPGAKTSALTCVLPGSFSGQLPDDLPWLG